MAEKKGEFALIDWIRRRSRFGRDVVVGIGDDCAAVRCGNSTVLLTTDAVLEGTHFSFRKITPFQAGWKAIASAVSDIAAMAGTPRYALAAVALPADASMKFARQLYDGMRAAADRCGVGIVGGNVASWRGKLAVTVSVFGEVEGRPITRGGAKVGDAIFVTGELGGSLLKRHVEFLPRISEALALRKAANIHAMIDVSDGLAADLHHVVEESGVGAVVYEASLPISEDARKMARRDKRPAAAHALGDGEDYELLFTVSRRDAERLIASPPFATNLTCIGEIVRRGFYLKKRRGGRATLKPAGYEHFT
jgi:thiamine-monophosphate kinase